MAADGDEVSSPQTTTQPEGEMERLEHRLLRLERLLAIGFSDQIAARRQELGFDDAASAAILRLCVEWTPAGELKKKVIAASGQPQRTVIRRLSGLVDHGALERRGKTASIEYRSTGLLG